MGAPNHLRWQVEQRRARLRAANREAREKRLARIQFAGWCFACGTCVGATLVLSWVLR